MTEDCFQQLPLDFVPGQTIVFDNGTAFDINGTYITEGTTPPHSMWVMNPVPGNSDVEHFPSPCPGKSKVKAPTAYNKWGTDPNECSGAWPTKMIIVDYVKIPANIPPGDWVLGWRWDCEKTTQIWQACSDITIV